MYVANVFVCCYLRLCAQVGDIKEVIEKADRMAKELKERKDTEVKGTVSGGVKQAPYLCTVMDA